jgi:Holliday junction resolvasome RuvABC DNA-binding subunit
MKATGSRPVLPVCEERFVPRLIAQLAGNVARVAGGAVVLDVHGVGYKVNVPASVLESLPPPGQPLTLVTHTLVREDDLSLFGFWASRSCAFLNCS